MGLRQVPGPPPPTVPRETGCCRALPHEGCCEEHSVGAGQALRCPAGRSHREPSLVLPICPPPPPQARVWPVEPHSQINRNSVKDQKHCQSTYCAQTVCSLLFKVSVYYRRRMCTTGFTRWCTCSVAVNLKSRNHSHEAAWQTQQQRGRALASLWGSREGPALQEERCPRTHLGRV